MKKYLPAILAVLMFSLTFPAVALGSRGFDPIVMSVGRVLLLVPAAIITLKSQRLALLPARKDLPLIALVAAGVIVVFPALSTYALQSLSVGASGIINSLTPIIASVFALMLGHHKPKRAFWWAAAAGTIATALFALSKDGHLMVAPLAVLALFVGVAAAALGNVAGATD